MNTPSFKLPLPLTPKADEGPKQELAADSTPGPECAEGTSGLHQPRRGAARDALEGPQAGASPPPHRSTNGPHPLPHRKLRTGGPSKARAERPRRLPSSPEKPSRPAAASPTKSNKPAFFRSTPSSSVEVQSTHVGAPVPLGGTKPPQVFDELTDPVMLSLQKLLDEKDEEAFKKQRTYGKEEIEEVSLAEADVLIAGYANPSTRRSHEKRWKAYAAFCRSKEVPIFPITAEMVKVHLLHAQLRLPDLALDAELRTLETVRAATARLWTGRSGFEATPLEKTEILKAFIFNWKNPFVWIPTTGSSQPASSPIKDSGIDVVHSHMAAFGSSAATLLESKKTPNSMVGLPSVSSQKRASLPEIESPYNYSETELLDGSPTKRPTPVPSLVAANEIEAKEDKLRRDRARNAQFDEKEKKDRRDKAKAKDLEEKERKEREAVEKRKARNEAAAAAKAFDDPQPTLAGKIVGNSKIGGSRISPKIVGAESSEAGSRKSEVGEEVVDRGWRLEPVARSTSRRSSLSKSIVHSSASPSFLSGDAEAIVPSASALALGSEYSRSPKTSVVSSHPSITAHQNIAEVSNAERGALLNITPRPVSSRADSAKVPPAAATDATVPRLDVERPSTSGIPRKGTGSVKSALKAKDEMGKASPSSVRPSATVDGNAVQALPLPSPLPQLPPNLAAFEYPTSIELSILEIQTLLHSLSSFLRDTHLATALHAHGIRTSTDLANLILLEDQGEPMRSFFDYLEKSGVTSFRRRVLRDALGELRTTLSSSA